MKFDDPKKIDDPQVLGDSKGISLGGMDFHFLDFHNPKSYVNNFIFDGLVELRNVTCLNLRLISYWPL